MTNISFPLLALLCGLLAGCAPPLTTAAQAAPPPQVSDPADSEADGSGLLTGVEAATNAEFDAQTERMDTPSPAIRVYHAVATTTCAAEG